MRNIFLLIFFGVSISGFSQRKTHQQNDYTFFTGDTSLNVRLYRYFEKHIKWEDYDTMCVESCMFILFKAGNRKVSSLQFSDDRPDFLKNAFEKALMSTAKFWAGKKNEDYLLPVVYIFENDCRSNSYAAGSIALMLRNFSISNSEYSLSGSSDDMPLRCVILNAVVIKTHYK